MLLQQFEMFFIVPMFNVMFYTRNMFPVAHHDGFSVGFYFVIQTLLSVHALFLIK